MFGELLGSQVNATEWEAEEEDVDEDEAEEPDTPVPDKYRFVCERVALLVITAIPPAEPALLGENEISSEAVCSGSKVAPFAPSFVDISAAETLVP
jgi:hypothetical protein